MYEWIIKKEFPRNKMRNLLIISLVLICVISVAQLGVSIFALNHQSSSMFIPQSSSAALLLSSEIVPLILSILSLFLVVIGGVSLKRINIRLLRCYAFLLLFVFIFGSSASIALLIQINNLNSVNNNLMNEFSSFFQSKANPFYYDYFQINFKCCGK